MRAIVHPRYGRQDALEVRDMPTPVAGDNQILVRVRAAGVNPMDWRRLTGTPYLLVRKRGGWFRPHNDRLGADFAGVVEAVGREVTEFRPGDEVFGNASGAFADYVTVRPAAGSVVYKPSGLSFEEVAAAPIAALTALQGLRDHGRLQPGHRVLVNGASGGVGTFAVQLAKVYGAEVTGVCGARNTELVSSLGADHVVDYTREEFTRTGRRYDLILDNVSNRSWSQYRRVLQPGAALVFAGGLHTNRWLGPWLGPSPRQNRISRAALSDSRTVVRFRTKMTRADLEILAGLLATGKVKSVVHKCYRLDETADALRCLGQGHVPGKLVILP